MQNVIDEMAVRSEKQSRGVSGQWSVVCGQYFRSLATNH